MEKNNKITKPFLHRFLHDQFYCGLDIGSQTIKASLVRAQDPDNLDLLGVYEVRTEGYKESAVSHLGELSGCVTQALNGLMKKTNQKINNVHLGIGGEVLSYRKTKAVIPLVDRGNKVISDQDVKKVNHQARLLGVELEEEVIHEFPIHYCVDDVDIALNPRGLYGRKLGCEQILVITNGMRLKNLIKAVTHSGFEVAHVYFNAYAAADVSLTEEQKQKGVVLIDVGSHVTNVLIFKDNTLRAIDTIKLGGYAITQSIAHQLNVTFDLAEDIKKTYGDVAKGSEDEEEILIKREDGYVPVKRAQICAIIEQSVNDIVSQISHMVLNCGLYNMINAGAVIVGGGALLPGLIERIEDSIHMPVKIGLLTQGLQNSVMYAGCVGLAQGACTRSLRYSIASKTPENWTDLVIGRVRELYHEYF